MSKFTRVFKYTKRQQSNFYFFFIRSLLTSQIRIRVGEYDFSHIQEEFPYVERAVARKVVHPKYNFFTYEFDLALIQLESPLEFAPHIAPICLPGTDDLLIGRNATGKYDCTAHKYCLRWNFFDSIFKTVLIFSLPQSQVGGDSRRAVYYRRCCKKSKFQLLVMIVVKWCFCGPDDMNSYRTYFYVLVTIQVRFYL